MPIRYNAEYFEFPKDPNLKVHKELPLGFELRGFLGNFEAWNRIDLQPGNPQKLQDKLVVLTKCHHCGGWVEGRAHEHHVNTLEPEHLAGRRGTEYYCPRCGKEIHFSGIMS